MWADIVAFCIGVWALQQQATLPSPFLAAVLLPLPFLIFGLRHVQAPVWRVLRRLLRSGLWLGAGFFWGALMAQVRLDDALPEAWEGRDIQISGVVASLPVVDERGPRFEFDVATVTTPNARVPRRVQLNWFDGGFGKPAAYPVPTLHPGERWNLTVRLKRPHGNANPYGFDYESWLLERNIRATGYVRDVEQNNRISPRVYRLGYLIESVRESASRRLATVLGERPYTGVLRALAIGEQSAISAPQWQVFLRTGVNHLMSISGLHVTMISSLAFVFAYWMWRRSQRLTLWVPARKAAVVAGVAAALAYAMLSGFGIPTQRTLYMLGVSAVALWLGRGGNGITVLALALLTVLLLDPWAVTSPGFWLSFGAVAVIFFVSAGRVGRPRWLAEWGRVQWGVTLGLVPALLAMFQQVSLISPLANAVAIPLVGLVVTPLTLAGTLLPFDFLLLAAHQAMAGCMTFLEWLSAFPGAVWQQHGPPRWSIVVGVLGVGWLLMPRGFPARWLGLLWLAPMFLVAPAVPEMREMWVTVLDVGQGLATVIRTRHHTLLYDAGPRYGDDADAGSRIVVPFLRATGVANLDAMVISHGDTDHSGGAPSVLQAVPVRLTLTSLPEGSAMLAGSSALASCHAGQSWVWDGVRFDLLHPGTDDMEQDARSNDRSCVLKASSPYGSVLLPADAETHAEKSMLQRSAAALSANVLVVPHHGSRNASSPEFVRSVHPDIAVFSVGYRNRFGHPTEEVVERYQSARAEIWRTDRDGALDMRIGPGPIAVQGWRWRNPRYWQGR